MQNFEIDFSELDKELKEKLNLNEIDECISKIMSDDAMQEIDKELSDIFSEENMKQFDMELKDMERELDKLMQGAGNHDKR